MTPLYVVIEVSGKCTAGCANCFRGFVKGPFDGMMDRDTFEAALKGIPQGTMILPAFHGEPLMHPDTPYFMKRFKEQKLRVSIPVSGWTGEKFLPLFTEEGTPCYVFIVSLDGFSEHSYRVRRGRIPFERAQGFVDEALRLRQGRKTPWIAVRWVEGGQSEVEFELFLKKWLFEKGVDFVLRSRLFNYGNGFNSPVSLGQERCRSLQEGNPVVLFNGDVLLCERTPDREKYVLGNVNKDDWPTIMARRTAMTAGYPNNDPCALCSAAYLLSGFKGIMQLRHGGDERSIYVHSDHSQTFYSLSKEWSGINWSLDPRLPRSVREE